MKKSCIVFFFIIGVFVLPGFRPRHKKDEKLGFTITVDGDQFINQTFFIPPLNANYCNLYFDFMDDPNAKRTVLTGAMTDNSLFLNIHVPIHKSAGSFTFVEDNIPSYMRFQFTYKKNGSPTNYLPGKLTVNITHYGNVGDFIEGNFSGDLRGGVTMVNAKGTFKVKRLKDKI